MGRSDSRMFYTVGSKVAGSLSALRTGHALLLVLIYVGDSIAWGVMRLEGLDRLKHSVTLGFEPTTFRFVASDGIEKTAASVHKFTGPS
jgi:hypothetical protein